MRHDGMTEQYMRTHRVAKVRGRLVIKCIETGSTVYCPPDFVRSQIRSRAQLQALADRLNAEWLSPTRAIVDFETGMRPTT